MTLNFFEPLANTPCPCRVREAKPLTFAGCCGPYLTGAKAAPTAQALMRSRYSAYALGGRDSQWAPDMLQYLQATWHPDTLPADLLVSPAQWTGLKVLAAEEHCDQGSVSFVAYYKEGGKTERLAEHSLFVKELVADKGRWLYTQAKEAA